MITPFKTQMDFVSKLMKSASPEDYIILNDIASSVAAAKWFGASQSKQLKINNENRKRNRQRA